MIRAGTFATFTGLTWALGFDVVAVRMGGVWRGRSRRPACGCADNHQHGPLGCMTAGCNCRSTTGGRR